jgi:hypothetical protein
MKRPLISIFWQDWGRSGAERRWQWPSADQSGRVNFQLTFGPVVFGIGRLYTTGEFYISLFVGRKRFGWPRRFRSSL